MKSANRVFAGLAVAFLTVGCGSSGTSEKSGESQVEQTSPESTAEFNDADVMFAQMMIPHHEQALELSDIALDPQVGASEAVRGFATQIKDAQDPEIELMTSLLSTWGQGTMMDSSVDHSSMMSGMLTVDELATLSQLRATEFDQAWLTAMIAHHEGAIVMARDVLDDGANADIRSLAERIIDGQSKEIDQMKALLG